MSWKKYGGTNKLDKINNISVNTVVTDKFTLKNFYVGDWDICGGLRAKDNTYLMRDLYVAGDISCQGDVNIDGSLNVLNTNIIGNVFVAENVFVRQNIFMDFSGGTMLHGENRRFGFGTVSPQATIDISGDLIRTIDIHTSTATNKNVIARNVTNQGITVNVEPSRAYIDFYVDNSMNLATENYNGRLVYEQGGNFTIDVSNIVKFKPRVIFSQDLSKNLLADERVIIYTNPLADVPYIPTIYGDTTFKTGTASYLVAGDNSSNVFFRLGTEKGSGLTLGGGYFPGDKIMGVVALTDASNTKYPAMNIISGNLTSNLKTSIAVNKYNVSTINGANRYAMDVNGPMKLAHQELIVAADVLFEVYRTVFYGSIGYAVGSPLTANPYTQYFLKTVDGGYTWTSTRIVGSNGNPNPNNLEDTAHFFSAIYAISESDILIAGDNRYFFRSTNGGQTWSTISFTGTGVNDGINITAIFLSDTRLIVGTGDNTGTSDGIILNSTTWNVGTISSGGAFYISTGLSAVNAIHGFGLDTVIVGVGGILPYRTSTFVFGTRVATTSTFNDVKVLNDGINHVVAVGAGVIWYAHDLSWNGTAYTVTWNQAATFSGVLRSLQVLDTMRAIAVGDNGLIMYSIDGYATWNTVTQGMLDNSSLITGIKLSTISILNANDFVVSGIIQDFVKPNTLGRTKIFNLYAPYFLNRPNHSVLEASGNVIMSGDLQINDAGQLLSNMTYFNILPTEVQEINIGNTVVGGNTNVKANLDVTLDITGHENMLLYGDASLNSRVFIGGDASLNSNLYVVKDSSFNGRIFVGGDASLNSKLFVAGDASFNSRVFVGNDVSLNSKLFVSGDASFNSRVFVGNDVSLNSKLFVAGDASFNSRVFVGGDVSLNSKLFVSGDASFNSRVFVGGDVSLNSKLFVSGDASFNSRVFVGGDVSFNSKLFVSGDASFNSRVFVGGDVSFNSKLFVGGDVSFNSKLFVGGDASFNSKLFVGGDVSLNSKLFVGGDASFNSKLFVGGDVSFNSKLFVGGDASFNSKLFVGGDVSLNSKLFVGGDASFNSKLFVGGDVSFNSKLFVGGDASYNSKLFVGGDVSFNSKLFVGGDVSFNLKLNVIGDVSFNSKLNVIGDVSFNSNLYVAQKTVIFDLSAQNADFTGIVRANTFDSRPGTSLLIGGTNAGNITIRTSTGSTNILTLGDAGSNVQILGNLTLPGSVTSTNVNNLEIKNKTILLNDEATGTNVSTFSGLQIRDDNVDNKGYFLTNGRSDGFLFKSTQNANRVNLDVSGLRLTNGMTQGFVVLKATSPIDISADYTITTGFVNTSDIQQLDASLNRRVERTSATTATTQVVGTNLLTNGLYVGKTVDNYIANSQMDILGNAFISRLGLGTSAVNTNYTLEVNNNTRIVNNLDVSNSLTVQNNINLYGRIVQW
jgi:hypothetical protein